MKVAKHLKSRRLLAVMAGLVVFGGAYGLADSLNLTSDNLGAGSQVVASCTGGSDVEATYDWAYNQTSGEYDVTDVVLDGVPVACSGEVGSITLAGNVTQGTNGPQGGAIPGSQALDTEYFVLPVENTTGTGPWPNVSEDTACAAPLEPLGPSQDANTDPNSCDFDVPITSNTEVQASEVKHVAVVISTSFSDEPNSGTAPIAAFGKVMDLSVDTASSTLYVRSGARLDKLFANETSLYVVGDQGQLGMVTDVESVSPKTPVASGAGSGEYMVTVNAPDADASTEIGGIIGFYSPS
jgi:hypothetical protein